MANKMHLNLTKPSLDQEELDAVSRVLRSGWVIRGPETSAFEEEFAKYMGAKYAIATNGCTMALYLVLKEMDLRPGDEVIVPSLTWSATAAAVINAGGTPVFADIRESDWCLDPGDVKRKITKRTKLVIPVHYAARYAKGFDNFPVPVLFDSAHRVEKGDFKGITSCYSFYAVKNMTTIRGGMILTDDAKKAEWYRKGVHGGLTKDTRARYEGAQKQNDASSFYYEVEFPGWNFDMTDVEAAVGRVQLRKLPRLNARRNEIVKKYNRAFALKNTGNHLYPITLPNRDEFLVKMKEAGIQCGIHYLPLHQMTAYKPYAKGALPVTEKIGAHTVSLPLHAMLTDKEVNYIIKCVTKILREQVDDGRGIGRSLASPPSPPVRNETNWRQSERFKFSGFLEKAKDYLYSFTYSSREKVKIKPYDPRTTKIAALLVQKIRWIYPTLPVYFIGSSRLQISGLRDIDLLAESTSENFKKYVPGLVRIFGTPSKRTGKFIEWKGNVQGYHVEFTLYDRSVSAFRQHIRNFEILQRDYRLRRVYEAVKKSADGLSVRDYERRKNKFLNGIATTRVADYMPRSAGEVLEGPGALHGNLKGQRLPTVSVGITAFNEQRNIRRLLETLKNQEQTGFRLKEIIVVSDGSTDHTVSEAKKVKSPYLKVVAEHTRAGQQLRQNQILRFFNGDILVLLEADVLPTGNSYLSKLIRPLAMNPDSRVVMAVGDDTPVRPRGLYERMLYSGTQFKKHLAASWKGGDNIYSCGGHSGKALARHFAKSLRFPKAVPEDAYIYMALKKSGLRFVKTYEAVAYMRNVSNFRDRLKQARKYLSGKGSLLNYFPSDSLKMEYTIPYWHMFHISVGFFLRKPIWTALYFFDVLLVRSLLWAGGRRNFQPLYEPYYSSKDLMA